MLLHLTITLGDPVEQRDRVHQANEKSNARPWSHLSGVENITRDSFYFDLLVSRKALNSSL